MFGLFNGMALLPVLLSLVGPPAYTSGATGHSSDISDSGRDNPAYRNDREYRVIVPKEINLIPTTHIQTYYFPFPLTLVLHSPPSLQ